MAVPSWDDLLTQARQITTDNADREAGTRTNQLLAQGLSGIVTQPIGQQEDYAGYVDPANGTFTPDKFSTGGSLAQRAGQFLSNAFTGEHKHPAIPSGAFPVTQKQIAEKTLPSIFKPRASMEGNLGIAHPGMSDQELEDLYGQKGITSNTSFAQLKSLRAKAPDLRTQSALDSHFATLDEIRELFKDRAPGKWREIPVSEVQDRRAQQRAALMSNQKSATQEEAKDLASGDVIRQQLARIGELAEKTNYAGIGPGAFVMGKLGEYSPVESLATNPDTVELYQQINDVMNQMVYLRSGKQINETEFQRLKDSFPAPTTNVETFKRRYGTFMKTFDVVMSARESRIRGAGRKTGGNVLAPTPGPSITPDSESYLQQLLNK